MTRRAMTPTRASVKTNINVAMRHVSRLPLVVTALEGKEVDDAAKEGRRVGQGRRFGRRKDGARQKGVAWRRHGDLDVGDVASGHHAETLASIALDPIEGGKGRDLRLQL